MDDCYRYDSGATLHVFNKKDLFESYEESNVVYEVMMSDHHTLNITTIGNVESEFTMKRN